MNKSGSLLVSTLWIVLILAVLAVWTGRAAYVELKFARYESDSMRAFHLAQAGLVKAASQVALAKVETGKWDGALPGGKYSYEISDEEAKFNIRADKAGFTSVNRYQEILKGLTDKMNNDTASAIIDWQDEDTEPLPGGAERSYYENLQCPYPCKDAPAEYTEELLLVKGMTSDAYEEMKDLITVFGTGKVNVNTAPEKVLRAIIGTDEKYSSLVKKMLDHRTGPDGIPGTADDGSLSELGIAGDGQIELTPVEASRLAFLTGYFDTRSNSFRIVSQGVSNGVEKTIICVIEKGDNNNTADTVRYYHEA